MITEKQKRLKQKNSVHKTIVGSNKAKPSDFHKADKSNRRLRLSYKSRDGGY